MSITNEQADRLKHYTKIIAESYGCLNASVNLFKSILLKMCDEGCCNRKIIEDFVELTGKTSYTIWQMTRDLGNAIDGMIEKNNQENKEV